MFLVDTNIFLEILLRQDKKNSCKRFLDNNAGNLYLTDFSLHSIGVILLKYNKGDVFQKYIEDVLPNIKLLSLPIRLYKEVISANNNLNLDFDDAYQYNTAKYYKLKLATMDKDFERIEDEEIIFL